MVELGRNSPRSGCKKLRPGYDTLRSRRFEFIPFWGIVVLKNVSG